MTSTSARPIRVLIAEDSPTAKLLLIDMFSSSPDFEVAGAADNGADAIARAVELSPDLIIMDVHMPILDGLDATKEIMRESPTPIVMVSSSASMSDVGLGLSATQAGALILMEKPRGPGSPRFDEERRQLLSMAKAMAAVKVVRRWGAPGAGLRRSREADSVRGERRPRIVAIGTSTGGPAALHRILIDLSPDFPVPIVVVQHMAHGFIDGLAKWLSANLALRVAVATDDTPMVPGTVYLGGDDRHLGVSTDGHIKLAATSPIGGFRPSADFLFDSCARAFGSGVLALILTGMGQDGVDGLRTVKARGGRVIAQDEQSSVVFGMNGKAIDSGLVDEVIPLDAIGRRLNELVDAPAP